MYDHKRVEQKWQKFWEQNNTFKVENTSEKDPYYVLDMFPYPSGAGLHVGHPEGMTANDIVARYKSACGYNVLHPMGWDAFGLPAENFAIKTGTHPRITTDANINNFRKQIKALGFSYDWEREVDTTDPEYYKWTQWIFLKLFEKGLAYEQNLPINYCPSCKTGLANEEVLNDFTCERCGTKVEKKKIRQWVLAITKYADRLLSDVDDLDWPDSIKQMQKNWIGKSEGCEFELTSPQPSPQGDGVKPSIRVYTTRIDTVFGMTYAVLAPDHDDVHDFIIDSQREICEAYIDETNKKSDQDRTQDDKEKTGVFTGSYVINPFNGKEVPLWIGDYVLGNYGTGAVMAVPAHDERDFAFAKQYDLEITQSIAPYIKLTGKNSPKKDYKVREIRTVTAIIKNVVGDKYLILEFISGERALVGGKVENGEDLDQAMIREVIEETGYKNVTIEEKIFNNAFAEGYDIRRDQNKKSEDAVYVVRLENDENTGDIDEDDKIKAIEWLTKKEVQNLDMWEHHKFFFNFSFNKSKSFTERGTLVNSGEFTGLSSKQAQEKMIAFAEENNFGSKKINFKLRDWLFSRQRYWGEPIPLVHCDDCGIVAEKEENLPILLPDTDNFEPSGDGTSPLSRLDDFVNCTCPKCDGPGKRETNTMPQWGGSCWYYLRYMDPNNSENLVDPEIEKYWGQVDSYVGGAEHAVLHLLYARFWHKFLFDIGVVSSNEPFYRLRNQGLILAQAFQRKNGGLLANDLVEEKDGLFFEIETGEEVDKIISKMSKTLKNVVNPDDIVEEYGADSLRLYEMYMAEFKDTAPWDSKGIVGVRRFLDKSERLFSQEPKLSTQDDDFTMKLLHKTVKKIESDIDNYKFNTAIASLMILVNNGLPQQKENQTIWKQWFVILLNPFAPHLAEELSQREGNQDGLHMKAWPKYEEKMTIDDTIKIGVQVLGKLRGTIEIQKDEAKEVVLEKAKQNSDVAKWLEGKDLVKEIYVPGKIVNLVIK